MTIVIVNYESWPDVVRLADSLRGEPELRSGRCEVVVVDNASTGPIPGELEGLPPDFRLILRPDNGGFAVGVNAGWRAARAPWLLVLNPDIEISPGFLAQVFARIDRHESYPDGPAGIVGFGLLDPDGSPQGSVGVFPTLLRSVREQFLPRARRKYRPVRLNRPGPVDWVTGACMLVNVDLLEQLGGLDEDFFLYHEEVALCREARARGWRIAFDPSACVVHRHPLQNRPISPKMRVITRHSKLLYFQKHLPRWQFHTLAAIVRGEALVRGVLATLAGRPEEARAWGAIEEMALGMRTGRSLRGRQVLALADSVARGETGSRSLRAAGSPPRPRGPAWRHRRARRGRGAPLGPRKDGPA